MNRGGRDDDADEELVAVVCGCGFGPPHAVAVLTLVALAVGIVAARSHLFGRASRYVQAMSYSATAFFHMIPAITATSTRLPLGAGRRRAA